jgi:hypothetical protein
MPCSDYKIHWHGGDGSEEKRKDVIVEIVQCFCCSLRHKDAQGAVHYNADGVRFKDGEADVCTCCLPLAWIMHPYVLQQGQGPPCCCGWNCFLCLSFGCYCRHYTTPTEMKALLQPMPHDLPEGLYERFSEQTPRYTIYTDVCGLSCPCRLCHAFGCCNVCPPATVPDQKDLRKTFKKWLPEAKTQWEQERQAGIPPIVEQTTLPPEIQRMVLEHAEER